MTAFEEGMKAAREGISNARCPHSEGDSRRAEWLAGWKKGVSENKPPSPSAA